MWGGRRRTFTGAWIETWRNKWLGGIIEVAPLRVRELKLAVRPNFNPESGRTFTGAWIETLWVCHSF